MLSPHCKIFSTCTHFVTTWIKYLILLYRSFTYFGIWMLNFLWCTNLVSCMDNFLYCVRSVTFLHCIMYVNSLSTLPAAGCKGIFCEYCIACLNLLSSQPNHKCHSWIIFKKNELNCYYFFYSVVLNVQKLSQSFIYTHVLGEMMPPSLHSQASWKIATNPPFRTSLWKRLGNDDCANDNCKHSSAN